MPVQTFIFPLPETRFFRAGCHLYKFKIRPGSNCSAEEMIDEEFVHQELEDAIRAVLANLDCLQPFTTRHYNIFPYKSRWERVSKLRFDQSGERLSAYPYLITLYLEDNTPKHPDECWTPVRTAGLLPSPAKRSKTNTPLEGTTAQLYQGADEPGDTVKTADGQVDPEVCESIITQGQVGCTRTHSETMEVTAGGEGEVHYGTEEEGDPEESDPAPDSAPESPERGGVLSRLASLVFPFLQFSKKN